MLRREQKRVVRHVREGSLLKLKSYLRRHPGVELSFSHGKRRRSPLHLACSLGDDAVLRLLLDRGSDASRKDRRGDTPLHLAAYRVLKHGQRAYDDLVVPLLNNCPGAMDTTNNAGVTPADLLKLRKDKHLHKPPPPEGPSEKADRDQPWQEKLFYECQDEFFETFGHDDDFLWDDAEPEDFGLWADRIRSEYYNKRRSGKQSSDVHSGRRHRKQECTTDKEGQELKAQLERDRAVYLQRAARKVQETLWGKRRRYEERCAHTFSSTSHKQLGYADIPWPAPRGSVDDMVEVMLHGADRSDAPAFRKLLRHQQTLWHPDKFAQRCGSRLKEAEKQRILNTVTALSQQLNKLAQAVR